MRLIAKARICPQILNDNLDKVVVDWNGGSKNQTLATGTGGAYMLARAENLSRTFVITHCGIGNTSISIHESSQDPIYNMAHMMHAVKVSSEPGLVLSPESVVIQAGSDR